VGAVDIETTRVGLGRDVNGRAGKQAIESKEQLVAAHPRDSSILPAPRNFVPPPLGQLVSPHATPFTRPTTLGCSHTALAAHVRITILGDFIRRHASPLFLPTARDRGGAGEQAPVRRVSK
jgi:hypothetical protein